MYSDASENEEALHQRVLRFVRQFATAPETMSMCELIGVEGILSIAGEL